MLKICAIDLDGVLAEYPKAWVEFANKKMNTEYNLYGLKKKLSYELYKKLKLEYRTSGIKQTLPVIDGAVELTHKLRAEGFMIIILTARPFYQIKEVFRDTLYWLKANDIAYDLIFAGTDKHIQILKYFEELSFMIEDNADIANKVAKLGYKVYLLDNEYNQQEILDGVKRIKKLNEVRENGKTKN